jgi:hypothetical protein
LRPLFGLKDFMRSLRSRVRMQLAALMIGFFRRRRFLCGLG